MSPQLIMVSLLVVWVLTGLCLGVVMGRRGYSGFGWGIIGMALGPLGIVVALAFRTPPRDPRSGQLGHYGPGDLCVLAAVDGSAAATAAAMAVAELLGPRVGRYTIATVIPYDATREVTRSAEQILTSVSEALVPALSGLGAVPSTIVLRGVPADSLRAFARDERFDVIAIGPHGQGFSTAVLGSVAASLVRISPVPVVVGGTSSAELETKRDAGREASASAPARS